MSNRRAPPWPWLGIACITTLALAGTRSWSTGAVEPAAAPNLADPQWKLTVHDSAGVTIADNHAPRPRSAWRMLPAPDRVPISDSLPHQPFYQVRDIAIGRDGSFVVAEDTRLRVFSPRGVEMSSIGGEGQGPGEFVHIAGVVLRGDSILALDRGLMRLSVFHSGRIIRVVPLSFETPAPLQGLYSLADGSLLSRLMQTASLLGSERRDGRHRLPERLYRYTSEGRPTSSIGPEPGAEVLLAHIGGILGFTDPPFGRQPSVGTWKSHVFVGAGDGISVNVLDSDGTLRRVIRITGVDLSITAGDVDAWVSQRTASMANDPMRRRYVDAVRNLAPPGERPGYARFLVSANGDLWLENYPARTGATRLWHVVDAGTGRYCGTLRLPEGLTLYDVRDGRAAGVYIDENGSEQVRLYEVGERTCESVAAELRP